MGSRGGGPRNSTSEGRQESAGIDCGPQLEGGGRRRLSSARAGDGVAAGATVSQSIPVILWGNPRRRRKKQGGTGEEPEGKSVDGRGRRKKTYKESKIKKRKIKRTEINTPAEALVLLSFTGFST